MVDAAGRRAVHLGVAEQELTLNFTVYELELGAFAALYAADFDYSDWDSSAPIDTSGMDPTESWQITYPASGIQEVILPEQVEPGLYVLTVSSAGEERDQLFLALTRNALVVKRAGNNLFVWASDINGEAAAEIEVRLYSTRGESIRQGETDENGIYRTTIPAGYEPLFVAARGGDGDVSIAGLDYAWRSNTTSYWMYGTDIPDYTIYSYTDRPIYRPGQTVYFKAILRADRDVLYSVPPMGTPVTVRIRDGRDNVVQTFDLATNKFGTVNGEFQIADGATLGDYSLEVVIGSESHYQTFKVQDYRKPEIQIEMAADANQYVKGDTITITGTVSYFFGEPVPNAQITVRKYYLVRNYYWGWWDEDAAATPD